MNQEKCDIPDLTSGKKGKHHINGKHHASLYSCKNTTTDLINPRLSNNDDFSQTNNKVLTET